MRSGFVALLGRPNVGKSTLLNALAGEHVSIATPKPETTRDRITAVITTPEAQVVFVDTPGIHRPHGELGEYMNHESRAAAQDADVVVMVADASDGHAGTFRDAIVIEHLVGIGRPVILAVNKIDRLRNKKDMLPLLEAYGKLREFDAVVPIAASLGDGTARLMSECISRLPEGEQMYPTDTLTDRPERYLVAERIREAVIRETAEELPYVTAVEIEKFDERAPVLHIAATIHVERAGQKKIMIGAGGERIRAVGTLARQNIERLLGRKVFLELWVKVSPDWTRSSEALSRLGYAAAPAGRSGK
ncbi:MAG: GTPase Era [Deltaproteobacteria bacterium]